MRSLIVALIVSLAGWTTASGQAPDKPALKVPIEDRLTDYLIAYNSINILTDNKVATWAVHRFAAGDEPVEQRIARCLAIHLKAAFPGIPVDNPSVAIIVNAKLKIEAQLAKDNTYVENTFKVLRSGLQSQVSPKVRESADQLEKDLNTNTTPAMAADVAQLAKMLRSNTGKELSDARAKMKTQLGAAVRNDPEAVKLFEVSCETTDDVRKSRERVRKLIQDATKP